MPRAPRHARLAAILTLAACVFLPLLGRQDVVNTHEARVAQTAREMAASGWPWAARPVQVPSARLAVEDGRKFLKPDRSAPPLRVNPWVVPVLSGDVRLQKPPLPYWCAAVLFRLAGEGAGAARLVPALLGAAATLLVYDLARRLLGRAGGSIAALLWVSSYFVVSEFRKTMADPYLAFFTLACVWAWIRAAKSPSQSPWLVLFYASLALGLLAKGPVILVHVPVALLAYHACYRRKAPSALPGHVTGLTLLVILALPWPLAVWRSVPHALELWRYESVGELADNRRNAAPFWAYLPKLPYLALPWTPLWAAALVYPFRGTRRAPRRRRLMFPLAWYALTVVFFSFVNLKKDAYLLPVMPAQVLLVTQFVVAARAWARRRRLPNGFDVLTAVQTGLGTALAAVVVVLLVWQSRRDAAAQDLHFAAVVIAAVAVVAAGIPPLLRRVGAPLAPLQTGFSRWYLAETVACAVAVGAFVCVYVTLKENRRSPRSFAAAVLGRLSLVDPPGPRALFRGGLPPTVAFYLPVDTQREESARTILVVAGKNGSTREVVAAFAAETGQAVAGAAQVPVGDDFGPDRWTLFELTLENRKGYAPVE